MKKCTVLFVVISQAIIAAPLPQKVVMCGVCKNVAARVPYSIKIMEKIGQLFSDYRVVVYENNSTDNTPQILKQWAEANPRVFAISENLSKAEQEKLFINRLDNGEFFRPECISRARNIVLDVALSEEYKDFEFLIWMDMDFKLEPSYAGIQEVFETTREWDAVFAYGIDPVGAFWDWFALRNDEHPIGAELLGNDWWYLPRKGKMVLSAQDDWYPVYSAFGGCGIYKKSSLVGCHYSAWVTRDLEKFYHNLIQTKKSNPLVKKYLGELNTLKKRVTIREVQQKLPDIRDQKTGVITDGNYEDIAWRMSSFVYKYPSVCEHVTLHASMIVNGHDKLFINPRLIFRYGG